ncbi:hypothetical protein [Methanobrevibacter cuticularis]|uniref:hypothetical protein n=1 Tax=Methanobrevibacter cuticularis TaxID=47311 RepID=UPI0012EDBBE3|nr:hypothetical protein [Methanobrevibacter cuticularis]
MNIIHFPGIPVPFEVFNLAVILMVSFSIPVKLEPISMKASPLPMVVKSILASSNST